MELNQDILNEYIFYLKKVKHKNKIQDLKLEYCKDRKGDYIYLVLIKMRRSEKNKGYGTLVLKDIVQLANDYNVRIILFVTNIYGSSIDRLYRFYERAEFVLNKNDKDKTKMIYYPKNNKTLL
jgi:GNAT superfamily N-acetyltransferase